MKKFVAITLATLSSATAWTADDPVVPVHEEPRHRLLYDNERQAVRVLELFIPPGDTTMYHRHSSPIFYVTLQDSALRTQEPGAEWQTLRMRNLEPGTVRTNDSYVGQPLTHRVSNSGARTARSILILNEGEQAAANSTVSLPGVAGIDSKWFRQSRIELGGGEELAWDGAAGVLVLVLISDTHVTVTGSSDSQQKTGLSHPGNYEVVNAGHGLSIRNHSREQATVIAVAVL